MQKKLVMIIAVSVSALVAVAGCNRSYEKKVATSISTTTGPTTLSFQSGNDGKTLSIKFEASKTAAPVSASCQQSSSGQCYFGFWRGGIGKEVRESFDHTLSVAAGAATPVPANLTDFTACAAPDTAPDPKTCSRLGFRFAADGSSTTTTTTTTTTK
jgi:hypothetical protein